MKRHLLCLLLLLTQTCGAAERVVSINLCTDELAILLAKPGQLLSVTSLVQNPQLSIFARQASHLPSHTLSLEQVLRLKPDLVLASRNSSPGFIKKLKQMGIKVALISTPNTISGIRDNLRIVGQLLDNKPAARKKLAQFDSKLTLYRKHWHQRKPRSALVFYPGGRTFAGNNLLNHLLTMSAMENIATRKGYRGWISISLEQIISWQPDTIVLVNDRYNSQSIANTQLDHPVFEFYRKQNRLLTVTEKLTSCGNPQSIELLRLLSARDRKQHE